MGILNYKAILYGFASYVMVWVAWAIYSIIVSNHSEVHLFIMSIVTHLAGLVPGYVAASIAKVRQLLHGLTIGIIIGSGIVLFWFSMGALENLTWTSYMQLPISTMIMSLLGSIVAKFYYERKLNNAL